MSTRPIHAVHSSDFGGMAVRAIDDECGWIYPLAVRRRGGISATAIRNGATGTTSNAVTEALAGIAGGRGYQIRNKMGMAA